MVTLLCRKNRKTPKRGVLLRFGHLIGAAGLQGEGVRHHFIDLLGRVAVVLLILLEIGRNNPESGLHPPGRLVPGGSP